MAYSNLPAFASTLCLKLFRALPYPIFQLQTHCKSAQICTEGEVNGERTLFGEHAKYIRKHYQIVLCATEIEMVLCTFLISVLKLWFSQK